MLSFALLEWRKNGRFLWGMAALFVLSLPLAAVSSVRARMGAVPGLEAGLLFWVGLVVPFAALFLGAVSGAGQRGDLARQAEALLPLSPARRASGALLSSVGQTLALAALVAAAASFSPTVRHAFSEGELWGIGSPFLRPIIAVSLFSALYGLLAGFCLSYALGHGILGGAAAVLLTLPIAGGLCWARGLELMFGPRVPFGFESWLIVAAAAAGPLLALPVLARWLDRRAWPGWRGAARVAGALALGLVVTFLALAHQGDRLLRGLFLADPGGFYAVFLDRAAYDSHARMASAWGTMALSAWPKARAAAASGALAHDIRGRAVWITPDGTRRELVPPIAIDRVSDLERVGPWIGVRDLAFAEDGTFFLVLERWTPTDAKPRWELWTGKEPPLKLALSGEGSAPSFIPVGRELYAFERWSSSMSMRKVGVDGKSGPSLTLSHDEIAKRNREAGLTALATGRKLVAGKRTWRLPGTATLTEISGLTLKEGPVFPVPVVLPGDRYGVALCGDSGVKLVMEGFRTDTLDPFRPAADGSYWRRHVERADGIRLPERWDILSAEGIGIANFNPATVAEALKLERSSSPPSWFLHADGRSVWMLVGARTLVKCDPSGRIEWSKKLPANAHVDRYGTAPYAASAEGLFWHTGRRILFFDWDGRKRDLGPVVGR